MAFSNTYNTSNPGSAALNRESLENELTILAPEETPVLSMATKGKAKASYHEWGTDSLDAPSSAGVVEGSDVSSFANKGKNKVKLGNRVQRFLRDWKVSVEQAATDNVGANDIAQSEIKCQQELKRDIELSILSDNDLTAGSEASAAQLRGFGDWLDASGPSDVPSAYRTNTAAIGTSGTSTTESGLNTIIDTIYNENGKINQLTGVFATALRRTISDFTRAEGSTTSTPYQVTQSAESKKITLAVSFYESDHGVISLVTGNPVCMPATDRGYLINKAFYGVDSQTPMGQKRLENQGGGERGYCDCLLTLKVKSPLAHGKIV